MRLVPMEIGRIDGFRIIKSSPPAFPHAQPRVRMPVRRCELAGSIR